MARDYDASGNALGSESHMNTNTTNSQERPAVASLFYGGFVTVWYGNYTGDLNIYSRLFLNASLPALSTISNSNASISPYTSPSLTPTPLPSSSKISTVPVYVLPPVESLVYGQTYPLYFNGQIIGSYTITGGVGPVKESRSNAIVISLNNNIDLPEGTPMVLFTVPTVTGTWATTSSFLTSIECEQVDPSVTLNNGSPIFIVTMIPLCSLGTRQALIASISLTL